MKSLPISQLYAHCLHNPIGKETAQRGRHATKAGTSYERASICVRMLLGELEWSDGYERQLDDCFECGDGNEVVGWLIEFSEQSPEIRELLVSHWNFRITGSDIITHWIAKGWRGAHRAVITKKLYQTDLFAMA